MLKLQQCGLVKIDKGGLKGTGQGTRKTDPVGRLTLPHESQCQVKPQVKLVVSMTALLFAARICCFFLKNYSHWRGHTAENCFHRDVTWPELQDIKSPTGQTGVKQGSCLAAINNVLVSKLRQTPSSRGDKLGRDIGGKREESKQIKFIRCIASKATQPSMSGLHLQQQD